MKQDRAWQEKLLPLMVKVVVGLMIFFMVTTLIQFWYFQWSDQEIAAKMRQIMLESMKLDIVNKSFNSSTNNVTNLKILLEYSTIERHFDLVKTSVMSRLWIKYLGFITGMVLVFIGAVFILGKMKEVASTIEGQAHSFSVTLTTTSPGVFMVVAGVALMLATILGHNQITQNYAPLFVNSGQTETSRPGPLPAQRDLLKAVVEPLPEPSGLLDKYRDPLKEDSEKGGGVEEVLPSRPIPAK